MKIKLATDYNEKDAEIERLTEEVKKGMKQALENERLREQLRLANIEGFEAEARLDAAIALLKEWQTALRYTSPVKSVDVRTEQFLKENA